MEKVTNGLILVLLSLNMAVLTIETKKEKEILVVIETTESPIIQDTISEWDIFVMALIEVESENNPKAIGKNKDGGILQITPIYVKEANRIQSEKVFVLDDRFDIQKSLEMFDVMNEHYNKERDIKKAIKIHNPNAPDSYRLKVMKRMDEVRKREQIRKHLI